MAVPLVEPGPKFHVDRVDGSTCRVPAAQILELLQQTRHHQIKVMRCEGKLTFPATLQARRATRLTTAKCQD